MVNAMAQTVVTAPRRGRTAGAGAGAVAHLMATVALQPMGAARALEMTGALVPKAMLVMMMAAGVHQEEASPPENLPSQFEMQCADSVVIVTFSALRQKELYLPPIFSTTYAFVS